MNLLGTVGGVLTGAPDSVITVQGWANPADLVPALGPDQPVGPIGAIGGTPAGTVPVFPGTGLIFGPGAFGGSDIAPFVAVGPYSLVTQVEVTLPIGGTVSY